MTARLDGVIAGLAFRATVDDDRLTFPTLAEGAYRARPLAPLEVLHDTIHEIVVAGRALERQRRDPDEYGAARAHASRLARWTRENPRPWIDRYIERCGEDRRAGYFYVSVTNGAERRLVRGPYATHREAIEQIDVVRRAAEERDPKAVWYAFGTARADKDLGPGILP